MVLLLRTYAFTGAKKIVLVSLAVSLVGIGIYQFWAALRAFVGTCTSLAHLIDLTWFNLQCYLSIFRPTQVAAAFPQRVLPPIT